MTKMMTKSPKNDFKIKSTRKNQEDSRKDVSKKSLKLKNENRREREEKGLN